MDGGLLLFSAWFLRPLFFKPIFLSVIQIIIKCSGSNVCHLHTDAEPSQCVFIIAVVFFSFIILFRSFLELLCLCFYNFYFYFSFISKEF